MRLTFSIAHAAHRPERIESLGRMLAKLRGADVFVESNPGKPHEWSLRQWEAACRTDATHAVLLNDDLLLCDNFIGAVTQVALARPSHLVNLYNSSDLAHEAQRLGLSWLTSPDGLIGNAYMLPVPALRAFLDWRASSLTDGTVETLSEDQLLNLWAMVQGCLVWSCVPALVDHDTTLPSCFANTQVRKPAVGPRANMLDVNWSTDALHTGRVFAGNHSYLLTRVKGERLPLVRRYYELAGDFLG